MKKKKPHTCKHCGAEAEYLPDVWMGQGQGQVMVGKLCDRCRSLFDIGREDGRRIGARAEREKWRDAIRLAKADYPAHAFPDGAGALVRQVLARVVMDVVGEEAGG